MKSPSTDHSARLALVKVLIADDDERIAIIIRQVLESLGFKQIQLVRDGTQAMHILEKTKMDMLITDWHMSPMDGITLMRKLRFSPVSPNRFMSVIMLTGHGEREHVEMARDVGVTEFVVKPFSARTLCDRIVKLIENPRSFILAPRFVGPDRRRRPGHPPDGAEKRKS